MTPTPKNMEEILEEFSSKRCTPGLVGIREEWAIPGTYQYHQCDLCKRKWHFGELPPICGEDRISEEVMFCDALRSYGLWLIEDARPEYKYKNEGCTHELAKGWNEAIVEYAANLKKLIKG